MFQSTWTWLEHNKDGLGALASLAGLVALIATLLALVFTGMQIRRSAAATRAATVYAIQKDAREFMVRLQEKPGLWKRAHADDDDHAEEVMTLIGAIINFYSSIFYQYKSRVLDYKAWAPFEQELKEMTTFSKHKKFWSLKKNKDQYDVEFKELLDKLFKQHSHHS